jgi:glyoxylase I family protein
MLRSLAHVSLLVSDTARALEFYCGVLGLAQCDTRPDLGYPGAWLELGGQQIHLLELPNPDPTEGRPAHGGRDRHTAIYVQDFDLLRAALTAHAIHYTLSRSGRRALFCRDPDGNALEFIEQR